MSQLKQSSILNESSEVLGGTVTKGDATVDGPSGEEFVLIYLDSGVSGDTVARASRGVFEVTKNTGANLEVGEQVYYDTSATEFTTVATGNVYAGRAWSAAATTGTTVELNLNFGEA